MNFTKKQNWSANNIWQQNCTIHRRFKKKQKNIGRVYFKLVSLFLNHSRNNFFIFFSSNRLYATKVAHRLHSIWEFYLTSRKPWSVITSLNIITLKYLSKSFISIISISNLNFQVYSSRQIFTATEIHSSHIK